MRRARRRSGRSSVIRSRSWSPGVLTEKGRAQDTHWTTRSMAGETGLSQSSVSRFWRALGLRPHVFQTWKLSTHQLVAFLISTNSPEPDVSRAG